MVIFAKMKSKKVNFLTYRGAITFSVLARTAKTTFKNLRLETIKRLMVKD